MALLIEIMGTLLVLLILSVPAGIFAYVITKKQFYDFKRLGTKMGLNLALPERKHLLSERIPRLVGDYKNRFVHLGMKKIGYNQSAAEFIINCNTDSLTATIDRKRELVGFFNQNYGNSERRRLLTGDAIFDKYFLVVAEEKSVVDLLSKDVREFLLERKNNITFSIEIRGYEIVAEDITTSNWVNSEGGIAENAVYMLNFLSELADLLERKRSN
jgi:hypothetical protein